MDTIRLKLDEEIFDILSKNGYKVEWAEFEVTDETEDLLYRITISPEMGNPDILREYNEVIAELNKLADDDNYCYYPTFEWALTEEWWNKSAVYEIIKNKN